MANDGSASDFIGSKLFKHLQELLKKKLTNKQNKRHRNDSHISDSTNE